MNEYEHDLETLDLEDIIREFSDEEVEEVEQTERSAEETAQQESAEQPEEPETEEPEETGESPVEEQKAECVETCATVRLDDLSQVTEGTPTELAKPLDEEDPEEVEAVQEEGEAEQPPEEEQTEEPEQPEDEDDEIDIELPHLPPLIFRPKSRMGELKRKLVAGPEKRYYELAELGVGKLQIAMLMCLLVVIVSGTAAVMFNLGKIPESRTRLLVFSQVLAMLLGGLLGSHQMIEGVSDLFRGKFTLNTLLAFTFLACCADGVYCFMELRVPVCACFTLEVAMSLWATYHKRTTEMGQMDTMRKAVRLDGIVRQEDYWENQPGYLRKEGQVEDFVEQLDEISGPERLQRVYALLSLLLSIVIAVVAGVIHNLSMAFQILSTTLLVAVPAGMFVCLTRPEAVLERRLHSLGTVLCGWNGVKGLCRKGVVPLNDSDLFPAGTVKMNGVKFYGDREPDETIAYATALITANGGSLAPIFEQLLESRGGSRLIAENVRFYGNGGIGGEVCSEPVLMGSLEFLKEMGVEIPEGTMVKQAVYVSIDGDLSGLFAISYTRTKFTTNGLATLHGCRKAVPVIMAKDFMMTGAFLKEKFGVPEKRMHFPGREKQEELAQKQPEETAQTLALMTQEGLAPMAYAITGARALRTASRLGMAIHLTGGILGILIMLALAIVGAVHLLTPVHVLLYQLIWLVPGLLVTLWPRTI